MRTETQRPLLSGVFLWQLSIYHFPPGKTRFSRIACHWKTNIKRDKNSPPLGLKNQISSCQLHPKALEEMRLAVYVELIHFYWIPPPKSDVQRGWPVQMLITLLCPHLFVFHPSLRPLCQFMSFWRINFSTSVGKFCWSNAIKDWTTQWIIQQSELTLPSHLDINHMPSHHPATHPQERSGFNKNSKNLKTNVK